MKDLTVKQQILHTLATLSNEMLVYLQKKLSVEIENRAALRSTSSSKLTAPAKNGSNAHNIAQHKKAQLRNIRAKNKRNPKKYNSDNLVSLRAINNPLHVRRNYFKALIKQDWSSIYPETNSSDKYYVYAHVNPGKFSLHTSDSMFKGIPFYIGKGTGNRAFDLKRNQGHGKEIKTCLDRGHNKQDIVNILYYELTKNKALEIEAKLIYFFGTIYQKDRHHTCLYNLDVPVIPTFIGTMMEYIK